MTTPNPTLHYEQALGYEMADKRLDILRRIGEAGSISEAARAAGVSYKAAWQALETLSNLAGAPLIDKAVGGSGGGGAQLTEAGKQLLRAADLLSHARASAIDQLNLDRPGGLSVAGVAGLSLKTSMRNLLPCRIAEIKESGGSVRVTMELANGTQLVSRITTESLQILGLKPGMPVLALFKATIVAIAPEIVAKDGVSLLHGEVAHASSLTGGGEVSLQLMPGLQVIGFARSDSVLALHQPAMAAIDEASIVIGLPG